MARKAAPLKRPLPELPVATAVKVATQPDTQSCGSCRCFLSTDKSTGKGRCRFLPPTAVSDRDATLEDPEGKRWSLCWESEWCYQWIAR